MGALELLENHPYSSLAIRAWFTERMFESFKDENVPGEIKEYLQTRGVDEKQLATFIDTNPRLLLDVFDSREVYIETFRENHKFYTKVNGVKSDEGKVDRKDAEWLATVHAFVTLEKILKPIESEVQEETSSD